MKSLIYVYDQLADLHKTCSSLYRDAVKQYNSGNEFRDPKVYKKGQKMFENIAKKYGYPPAVKQTEKLASYGSKYGQLGEFGPYTLGYELTLTLNQHTSEIRSYPVTKLKASNQWDSLFFDFVKTSYQCWQDCISVLSNYEKAQSESDRKRVSIEKKCKEMMDAGRKTGFFGYNLDYKSGTASLSNMDTLGCVQKSLKVFVDAEEMDTKKRVEYFKDPVTNHLGTTSEASRYARNHDGYFLVGTIPGSVMCKTQNYEEALLKYDKLIHPQPIAPDYDTKLRVNYKEHRFAQNEITITGSTEARRTGPSGGYTVYIDYSDRYNRNQIKRVRM